MKIERLVDVCPTFAEALADYDLAMLQDTDPEILDGMWLAVCAIAAAFREGAAFALGTTPEDLPILIDSRRALNA